MQKKCMSDYSKKEESYLTIIKVIILTVLPVILSTVLYNISNVLDQSIYNHYMMDLGLPDEKSYCWGVYSGKYKLLTNLPIAIANAMCSAIVPSLTLSVSQNDFGTGGLHIFRFHGFHRSLSAHRHKYRGFNGAVGSGNPSPAGTSSGILMN